MKPLHYFNLFGVLALAALCVVQWQRDRQCNLEVIRLERLRFEHESKLTEQKQAISGVEADLGQFKERLAKRQAEWQAGRQEIHLLEREAGQLSEQRDQLKSSITNYAAAVAARDDRLKEANTEIQRLADERNAAVRKFNELATNHNAVVKELNEFRRRLGSTPVARPTEPGRAQ